MRLNDCASKQNSKHSPLVANDKQRGEPPQGDHLATNRQIFTQKTPCTAMAQGELIKERRGAG
jgi:hypothetical protein